MADLKQHIGTAILVLCIGAFAWWHIRDSAQKDVKFDIQAQAIKDLTEQAGRIDKSLAQWRRDYEGIDQDRQDTRRRTREAGRNDPSLQEQLAVPLHPALRPVARGGLGLLGGSNGTYPGPAQGADAAHPSP